MRKDSFIELTPWALGFRAARRNPESTAASVLVDTAARDTWDRPDPEITRLVKAIMASPR